MCSIDSHSVNSKILITANKRGNVRVNVSFRRIRVTVDAVESTKYSRLCVCSLSYPARKAHAPYYCHLLPVWLYHIFSHYLTNGTTF